MATARQIAEWMQQQVQAQGELTHEDAVRAIRQQFGSTWVKDNHIHKEVLYEFKELTFDSVVYIPGKKRWKQRQEFHASGRAQDARPFPYRCARCGIRLAEHECVLFTKVIDHGHALQELTETFCSDCTRHVEKVERARPRHSIDYQGYWIVHEHARLHFYGDRDAHSSLDEADEYVIIDPDSREEIARCSTIEEAREYIDELVEDAKARWEE
jgi:uncharacterized protein with PIN domain